MNAIQKQIHHHLQRDWDNFPFKLDYILYLLHTGNQDISDIYIIRTGRFYMVCGFRNGADMHKNFEQDELSEYLNINTSLNELIDFSYTTKIFAENHTFRGAKTPMNNGDLIVFRFLDSTPIHINLNQLLNPGDNSNTPKRNARFAQFNQEFNQLIKKYDLYNSLKESLNDKNSISEKRLKI